MSQSIGLVRGKEGKVEAGESKERNGRDGRQWEGETGLKRWEKNEVIIFFVLWSDIFPFLWLLLW